MRQGLWKCPRCGFYWVWRTSNQVLKLDRVCRKDDHRIQINLDRKRGNRGRPRPTSILEYPSYRPMDAIIAEAKSRNRKVSGIKRAEDRKLGYEDGFVKATVISDNLERFRKFGLEDPTKRDDEMRDLI